MKGVFKKALIDTIPVLSGYLVLGFGFGIILKSAGFDIWLAVVMSMFIYAGSMQYVAVGLLSGGASIITTILTTLMVNARHLFYGVSMLEKYNKTGLIKPYLIFGLTDETYSLLCTDNINVGISNKNRYYFLVTILNHSYWVIGTFLGALIGSIINFNTTGIDFALTALFVTVFLDQWLNTKKHFPAIIGLVISIVCLLIFGTDSFLIPTMVIIATTLCLYTLKNNTDSNNKDITKVEKVNNNE